MLMLAKRSLWCWWHCTSEKWQVKYTVRKMAFNNKDIAPLWHNGPTPGAFYQFPGNQYGTGGFQKSQYVLFDYNAHFFCLL